MLCLTATFAVGTVALAGSALAQTHVHGGDPLDPTQAQASWVDPVVLVSLLWTVPFVVFLALRFRRTWLRPVTNDASRRPSSPKTEGAQVS